MEKGYFGQYTGNARHSHTPVTKKNYRASVADDAAHIHYLKEDVNYDNKHGHSDENMTADEKHISKLAGDMKYDKKHHSPFKQMDEREGRVVQPFVDPGAPEGFVSSTAPYEPMNAPGTTQQYDEEAASKTYLKKQSQVQDAINTLEKIEGGYTPNIPFANPQKIVTNALLGSKGRRGRMTREELDALNRSSAQDAYSYLSSNIRNAPLGDAQSSFNRGGYNPTKLRNN